MLEYVAKILKTNRRNESTLEEITSPYRESKNLPPSTYDPVIEAEIIFVKKYNTRIKTSCFTTIGFRSYEEVVKYGELSEIKTESAEMQSVITLMRLLDLEEGELIKFSYPKPDGSGKDYNLIRYKNEPLTIDDFKNKSYPSKIDNTLEDSPRRFPNFFTGLSQFERVNISCVKQAWFRLQVKYPFLIEVKQKLFYTKWSRWKKIKLTVSIVGSIILIIYALNPTLLSDPKHRWAFVIATLISVLKELF